MKKNYLKNNRLMKMKLELICSKHLKNQPYKEQHSENKLLMKCKQETKVILFLFPSPKINQKMNSMSKIIHSSKKLKIKI